jgi:ribosome-binding protein aMBF1 (putative translation factor)
LFIVFSWKDFSFVKQHAEGTCTVASNVTCGNHAWVPNLSKQRQDPALVSLGGAIRRIRLERGISQEALALLAEVDRSYVGRVERGDNNVAVLTLVKLASALQITVTKLMKEAGL